MSWVPQDDGSTLCEEHGERFRAPVTCSKCDGAASAIEVVTTEAELLDERAAEMDLGDELDDERWFLTASRRLWSWAKAAHGGEGHDAGGHAAHGFEPNHKAAHNYVAEAIKARRAKAELTARRRDWLRYERAAKRALGIRSGTPEAAALTAAMKGAAAREVSN